MFSPFFELFYIFSVPFCDLFINLIFGYLNFLEPLYLQFVNFSAFYKTKKNRLLEGVPSVQRWFCVIWLFLPFNFRCCDILAKPFLADLLEDALLIEFLEGLV